MDKVKSQQTFPSRSSSVPKSKSQFIYKSEDDMYLFQNKQLFMQLQFRSPIKQICQYLEQYQKYYFLGEVSSIGIKASQQRDLYEKITQSVNRQFQKYLQKTLLYIQEMIMNVHFLKYQRWHYFARIVQGYKRNVLHKDIDCYGFNKAQFSPYHKKVMEYLKNIDQRSSSDQLKQRKMQIISNRRLIQKKVIEIHENMYVKFPYKTQNQKRLQVNSDQLFQSFLKKFIFQTTALEKSFEIKFHNLYDNIHKFSQFMKQFSIKGQSIVASIIRQYNQNCANYVNSIGKSIFKQGVRNQIQMNDYYTEWKKGDKITPILRNKMEKVVISNRIICRNAQTSDNFCLIMPQQVPKYIINTKNQQDDQIYNSRVPVNNPYFDFWQHIYDRSRLRRLQLFYENPRVIKKYVAQNRESFHMRYRKKFIKQKIIFQENIYSQLINKRISEQQKIWETKNIGNILQSERILYEASEGAVNKNRYLHQVNRNQQTNNKLEILQKKINVYLQLTQRQQKEKKVVDELAAVKLRKCNNGRNYQQFLLRFGIKQSKRQVTTDAVTRYGIKVPKFLFEIKDVAKFQEFLCNFLKQKLFRDNQKYKDKQSMPLMFNVKPAQEFCNWRTIKRLGELSQNFKKFYIWASEIIKYEEETTIKKQKIGKFTIYAYSDIKNSRSIVFELKRRLNTKIAGQIIQSYNLNDPSGLQTIVSKFQLMHRLLFNMHIQTPNPEQSYKKGQKIYSLLVRQLTTESYNQ